MNKRFGWIKQEPDHRDKEIKFAIRELPKSDDLRPQCPPVVDQENLGSCTANAIAGAYAFEHLKQGEGEFNPSRLFIYYNERVIEHTIKQDAGAIIRDGFKVIHKKGVCSEESWPYVISKFDVKPSKQCFSEALKNQAIQYMAVQQTPLQLKSCLADGYPFVFGFMVYSNFMNIGANGIMPMPAGAVEGGHAVMCVGYNETHYIIRNSWGSKWGDKGYFYMPYEYMHNENLCSDFWTIRKVE